MCSTKGYFLRICSHELVTWEVLKKSWFYIYSVQLFMMIYRSMNRYMSLWFSVKSIQNYTVLHNVFYLYLCSWISYFEQFLYYIKYYDKIKFQIYITGGIYVTVVGFALSDLTCSFWASVENVSLGFHTKGQI